MRDNILLVTGASSEVGASLIRNVSAKYKRIWAHYNTSEDVIRRLQSELGNVIVPIQADFSDGNDTQRLIDEIKDSDMVPDHIVHLSAPKAFNKQFYKCTWEDYQNGIDTSLRSVVMILKECLPMMSKKKYGKVVFMLSTCVIGVPPKYQSTYITVKYALLGLMRNLAAEYAGKGIAINAVSPDMMETKFLSDIPELIVQKNAKNNPLGRNIFVEEVVPTFEYLLSEASNIVMGQNIGVTGGGK